MTCGFAQKKQKHRLKSVSVLKNTYFYCVFKQDEG